MSDVLNRLEQSLKETKEVVARRDLALRLGKNRDFQKLILQDYIVDEAARLAGNAGDPTLDKKQQRDALAMALAAGHLKRYLQVIVRMGDSAQTNIAEIEDAIQQVQAEGDDSFDGIGSNEAVDPD